ncbi:MAG: hypothetical protein AAGA03_13430 [Planctomycetota bacterium]
MTVSIARGQAAREVQLPATQFADFASTVQQLSGELRQLRAQATVNDGLSGSLSPRSNGVADPEPPDALELGDESSPEETMRQAAQAAEAEMLEVERRFMRQLMEPQRIDLSSSFSLDGTLYRVIDFTRDTLLLEQVPLGKYLIVR